MSHIYNLRRTADYKKYRCNFEKTKGNKSCHTRERRKPANNSEPGYIRIDTVHQGDLEGKKGRCYINAVDEVTQSAKVQILKKPLAI